MELGVEAYTHQSCMGISIGDSSRSNPRVHDPTKVAYAKSARPDVRLTLCRLREWGTATSMFF